jgi:crotonobetainyl-CoA:carnitine CoA-transferase CaiB-like acyl-CoA transferase
VFETQDGAIMLTIGNDPTFSRFCTQFGEAAWLADPRLATNAARVANRTLIEEKLTPLFKQHPTNWWVEKLEAQKIGYGPINQLSDVFSDPHVLARGNVIDMRDRQGAAMKLIDTLRKGGII